MYILGIDIGGTKCAAVTARYTDGAVFMLNKATCNTDCSITPEEMIKKLFSLADKILEQQPDAVGISCGGPLDSEKGIILNPPNLTGWNNVEIVRLFREHYGVTVKLQNDANACALAEWKFGAGNNCKNMVFLTFGTGLGAGLIINGKLYEGSNGNAGEIGHIRLDKTGPVGYGKQGSFEGFCSGGGIARLAYNMAAEKAAEGIYPSYFKKGMCESDVTAKSVALAADSGDETAAEVYRICGEYLGRGLAVVIDILNPQKIVIGSVYARSRHLLYESMKKALEKEALPCSVGCCQILPAGLGESIGDYAAIVTAVEG